MICVKCGKEISANEIVCPYCGQETFELEMPMAGVVGSANEKPKAFVSKVVRQKPGKARVITAIIAFVLTLAALVVSFLKPIAIVGEWKLHQTIPAGMGQNGQMLSLEIDSVMKFTMSGEMVLSEDLLNYAEFGYPEEERMISRQFRYRFVNDVLMLDFVPTEEEAAQMQQPAKPVELKCSVTPSTFSYWEGEQVPREVFDYQRVGHFYPAMYLWLGAAVFFLVGVLLLAIPGKKKTITVPAEKDDVEEAEDLDEFLEEVYEEIEEDSNQDLPEEPIAEKVAEESVTEEVAETPEATEE